MFCDRCGASVAPEQRFCGQCGKPFVAAGYVAPSRVREHVRLLGILWLALSTLSAVGGVVCWVLARTVFAHLNEMGAPPDVPAGFLRSLFSAIGTFIILKAAVGFAAGWGLLRRESWARLLTVVLSFFALLNIPLGTALGIYSLWVLLPAESERDYAAMVAEAGATG